MYEVKDGSRTLQFSGKLLGASSSWRPNAVRWIEFKLYKTESGSYIVSRVGVSNVYHGAACNFVSKYRLNEASPSSLRPDATPCEECVPSKALPFIFPEKDRTRAHVVDTPEDVIDILHKKSPSGSFYLTKVARKLLEAATNYDEQLDMVYRIEIIP